MNNFKEWFNIKEAISTMDAGSATHLSLMASLERIEKKIDLVYDLASEFEKSLYDSHVEIADELQKISSSGFSTPAYKTDADSPKSSKPIFYLRRGA